MKDEDEDEDEKEEQGEKEKDKEVHVSSALEKFQIVIAIFVSLTTAFIGWKTFQLDEHTRLGNDHLKSIEIGISERKFDFEQFKEIYDRKRNTCLQNKTRSVAGRW